MKLIAISSPVSVPNEAEIINSLFRSGLAYFHLRKPGSAINEINDFINQIDNVFYPGIVLHQHHEVAAEFNINRLHFTESLRNVTAEQELFRLKEAGYKLSTSIHDLNQISLISPVFDYTFFGPVFDSISKIGYKSVLPDAFVLVNELKKIPIIGLGGIDISNLEKVRKMNFDGAAVLGTLWEKPDRAVEVFKELLALEIFDVQPFRGC